jgi:hypothetical protein
MGTQGSTHQKWEPRQHPAQDGNPDCPRAPGLEALGIVVIEHDNIVLHPTPLKFAAQRRMTAVVTRAPPSLRAGDPLHYHSFIQRICNQYTARERRPHQFFTSFGAPASWEKRQLLGVNDGAHNAKPSGADDR